MGAIGNVGSTFSPSAGQSGGGQTNAGKIFADREWASNSGEAKFWKDRYGATPQTKSAFEGYEEWMEQQGLQVMQQCADDMGSDDG